MLDPSRDPDPRPAPDAAHEGSARTSADGTVLRPVPDRDDGVRECAGDGAALPFKPPLALTRPSIGGFIAKLGPASDAANGFAGDVFTVP